jgi:hypothetical protein
MHKEGSYVGLKNPIKKKTFFGSYKSNKLKFKNENDKLINYKDGCILNIV